MDEIALMRWLDDQGLAPGADLEVSALQGGSQNELWQLRRGDEHLVLRRPPEGAARGRIDEFTREQRLLRALKGTAVPHAELAASCDDAAVLGGPFYVMQFVDGWSPAGSRQWPAAFETDLKARHHLAYEIVRGAAELSKVDWRARGLEGFGRPEDFHERQADRWMAFLKNYQFRDLPGLEDAAQWLRTHRPRTYEPGIMHGDYQFANVMYRPGGSGELAAIIDWEMTTVGDPLLDLAWVLTAWSPEGDDMVHARYLDLSGMPSRDDLLQHYATLSGRPVDDIDYYVVLARFKLGIVLEKSVARERASGAQTYVSETFAPLVLELIRKAAELSRSAVLA